MFYRRTTLRLAARAHLHTIICDGVHQFHPSELGRKAQLYSLHGVCGDAQSKPLVYIITTNKLASTYLTIFQHIASRLQKYGVQVDKLNVVLDFETAAHRAAEQVDYSYLFKNKNRILKVFDPERVVGCLFHFSMALSRNMHAKGLSPFLEGNSRNPDVVRFFFILHRVIC